MGIDTHFKHGAPIVAAQATSGDSRQLAAAQRSGDGAQALQVAGNVANLNPAGWPTAGSAVHTLCTSNGSPYVNFQNRIMYATYKLAQNAPGGDILAGFTRILHRTVADELMQVRLSYTKGFCVVLRCFQAEQGRACLPFLHLRLCCD